MRASVRGFCRSHASALRRTSVAHVFGHRAGLELVAFEQLAVHDSDAGAQAVGVRHLRHVLGGATSWAEVEAMLLRQDLPLRASP